MANRRLLRAQGNWSGALEHLDQIVQGDDPVWRPMALLEQMRIYDTVALKPKQVTKLGARFLKRYPKHPLVKEARKITCRAHKQLKNSPPSHCTPPL